jgi:hypothetical protein
MNKDPFSEGKEQCWFCREWTPKEELIETGAGLTCVDCLQDVIEEIRRKKKAADMKRNRTTRKSGQKRTSGHRKNKPRPAILQQCDSCYWGRLSGRALRRRCRAHGIEYGNGVRYPRVQDWESCRRWKQDPKSHP